MRDKYACAVFGVDLALVWIGMFVASQVHLPIRHQQFACVSICFFLVRIDDANTNAKC